MFVHIIKWRNYSQTYISHSYNRVDIKGVYDKYNAGAKVASLSSNCDLYYELFSLLRRKNIQLKVKWMPSHLLEKPEKPKKSQENQKTPNLKTDKINKIIF